MATFEQWKTKNSLEYRGYVIAPGTIEKDGEPVLIFATGLNDERDAIFATGKRLVDELLAKAT